MSPLRRRTSTATSAAASSATVCLAVAVVVAAVATAKAQLAPLGHADYSFSADASTPPSSSPSPPPSAPQQPAANRRQSCDDKKYASAWPPRNVKLRMHDSAAPTVGRKREEITIGAMIKVHEMSSAGPCGPISPMGVLEVQMLIFTVERLNEYGGFPFSIGLLVKDDCGNASYALEQSLEFVEGFIMSILKGDRRTGSDECGQHGAVDRSGVVGGGDDRQRPPYIAAVVGATGSASSIQMTNLLKLFKIPQIGYWTTNSELTNKRYYKYYLRTIPNEDDFLEIIGKVVVALNWNYVSIVYEDFPLSKQSQSTMEAILRQLKVCVALSLAVKPAEWNLTTTYESIINRLSSTQARGVIVITSETSTLVSQLMRAVRSLNATGRFVWLGNRDWSRSPELTADYPKELEGAITVEPSQKEVDDFRTHLLQLDPLTYNQNPWFREWFETTFRCKFGESESHWSPHTCAYQSNPCSAVGGGRATVEALLGSHAGLLTRLQLIHDAVMAIAFGLQKMHSLRCEAISKTALCSYMNTTVMNPERNEYLLDLMQGNRFKDLAHTEFNFSDDGDGPRRFQIFNFQSGPSGRAWKVVGNYSDDLGMQVDTSAMRFAGGSAAVPVSVCSKPCAPNQAKMVMDNQPCCWSCIDCGEYEWLAGGSTCQACPLGSRPARDKASCIAVEPARLTYEHPVSVAALVVASLGIAVTLAVGALFVAKRHTPVVRAAGREMTFVLLAGILLCYVTAFVVASEPSDVTCVLQNSVPGVSFAICYAAILLKANRIYRIFNSGRRSTRRPRCVSPLSTVCLCAGIVFVQLLITSLWLVVRTPHAGLWHPSRSASYLACLTPDGEPERGHMVAFAFPMALLVACIVHAVLTRKIPGAFNESKLIGFTVYTTCIIWLAFVPLYLTAGDNLPIMLATECFAILLSATVGLACVFFPKAYIIIFRAEKNARPRGGGTSFRSKASFRTNNSYATEASAERSSAEQAAVAAAADSPRGNTPSPHDSDSKGGAFFSSAVGRSPNKRARIHLPPGGPNHAEVSKGAVGEASGASSDSSSSAAATISPSPPDGGAVPKPGADRGERAAVRPAANRTALQAPAAGGAQQAGRTAGLATQTSGDDNAAAGVRRAGTRESPASAPMAAPAKAVTSSVVEQQPKTAADGGALLPPPAAPSQGLRATDLLAVPQRPAAPATTRKTAAADGGGVASSGNAAAATATAAVRRAGATAAAADSPPVRQQRTMYDMLIDLSERTAGQASPSRKPAAKSEAQTNNNDRPNPTVAAAVAVGAAPAGRGGGGGGGGGGTA